MIADQLLKVKSLVSAVSIKLSKSEPLLLAVSKTKPFSDIQSAYDAGQRHFGENYVQEIVEKAPLLPGDINWHFIGHLQSNKVKSLLQIPNLFMIESVDSLKLATKLQNCANDLDRDINVLVEIKTSTEELKTGATPEIAQEIVEYIVSFCPRLHFKGLMTVGDPENPVKSFESLQQIKKLLSEKYSSNESDLILSMGMSGDLEEAIAAGSTEVRIGTAIFGSRNYE